MTREEHKFQMERKQRCTNRNIHTTVKSQKIQDSQMRLRVTDEDRDPERKTTDKHEHRKLKALIMDEVKAQTIKFTV